jgi:hypothetical protein
MGLLETYVTFTLKGEEVRRIGHDSFLSSASVIIPSDCIYSEGEYYFWYRTLFSKNIAEKFVRQFVHNLHTETGLFTSSITEERDGSKSTETPTTIYYRFDFIFQGKFPFILQSAIQ